MSLWYCLRHGITGPTACCVGAARAEITPTVAPMDASAAFHAACYAWAEAYRALVLHDRACPEECDFRSGERWQHAHASWFRRWKPLHDAEHRAYAAMELAARAIGGTIPPPDRRG